MNMIQSAVAACLQSASGVKTVCDRARTKDYPLLAVSVQEEDTVLIAGGKQAEHTYAVTVTAVSDRDREGNAALLAGLPVHLLRGVPMVQNGETRTLHPLNIRTEGEELTFTLTLCVPVPPVQIPGQSATERMESLHIHL